MSKAVSLGLLGENDVSKIYLVDSQSLGQKHCFLITKIFKRKRLLQNVVYGIRLFIQYYKNLPCIVDKHLRPL